MPMAKGLAALSPGCKEASRLQGIALNHKLNLLQRAGLQIHLLLCNWCRRYGKRIRFLQQATHEHTDHFVELPSQNLSVARRERIKQRLHESDK